MKHDLFCSLVWASKINGPVVYKLVWSGKPYVGSSVNLYSRLKWWRIDLAGKDVLVEVLELVAQGADRFEREAFHIKKANSFEGGHNKTATGKSGVKGLRMSEESKAKISAANTGMKRTDETKQKMRAAKLGKKQDPVHVEARRHANTGKKRSDEARANISAARVGKPLSEAHKAALKAAWVRRRANDQSNLRQFAFGFPHSTTKEPYGNR